MASSASLVCSWSTACIPRLKVRLRGLLSGSRSPPQAGKPILLNMQYICMHGCIHLLVISDQASITLTGICIHYLAFTLIRQISCSSNLPLDSWSRYEMHLKTLLKNGRTQDDGHLFATHNDGLHSKIKLALEIEIEIEPEPYPSGGHKKRLHTDCKVMIDSNFQLRRGWLSSCRFWPIRKSKTGPPCRFPRGAPI